MPPSPTASNLIRLSCSIAGALSALVLTTGRAHASCPIALRGDTAVATHIQAELDQFAEDNSPCVALEITCGASNGGVTIELDDELGGHALRTFDSAGGAGAFLISWSRRPGMASPASVAAPLGVARSIESPAAPAAPSIAGDPPWRGELRAAYIPVLDSYVTSYAIVIGAALVQHYPHHVRAGFATQWVTAPTPYDYDPPAHLAYVGGQLEGTIGVEGERAGIRTRVELAAGLTEITRIADNLDLAAASYGPHAAVRLTAAYPLVAGVALEVGAGFGVLWQVGRVDRSPLGDAEVQPYPYLQLGLAWAP